MILWIVVSGITVMDPNSVSLTRPKSFMYPTTLIYGLLGIILQRREYSRATVSLTELSDAKYTGMFSLPRMYARRTVAPTS